MSAAERTARIKVTLSDLDKKSGVELETNRLTFTYDTDEDKNLPNESQIGDLLVDDTKLGTTQAEKIAEALIKSEGELDQVTKNVTVTIYDENGFEVASKSDDEYFGSNVLVKNGYEIVISYTVDNLKYGETVKNGTADQIDDREQVVISVATETRIGSGVYNKPKAGEDQYVVNKGDNVAKLVLSEEYEEFPYYDVEKYNKDDEEYVFVYEGDLTNVTEDITVKATYAKNVKDLNRFGKVEAEEEKEYDELDANKDGVVSCEEALGKGWVWNNETSACELKGSSNTGSYVPNTATK